MSGFKKPLLGLKLLGDYKYEKIEFVLSNYEKMLIELSDEISLERALCIIAILKISIRYLGKINNLYIQLEKTCKFIVNQLEINKNEKWYKEFEEIMED